MDAEITKYIENAYNRWLDYSGYHCSIAKIEDESYDILNEVILSLLKKDERKIRVLYNTKKGKYRELDFYVLRMINLNVYSPTSPYQSRYKPLPVNENVNLKKINLQDVEYDFEDKPGEILEKLHQVRDAFEKLNLSEKAKRIFEHRFFHGLSFSEWPGSETKKELYDTYNRVVELIKKQISGDTLI